MKRRVMSFVMVLWVLSSFCIAFAADDPVFSDVAEGYWAYDEIMNFAKKGIVNGMEDGTFQPGGNVTREQFAKMLVLTFDNEIMKAETPTFSDVPASAWAYGYVETVKDYLPGYTEGGELKFYPRVYATREDIASALVRLLGISAESPTFAKDTFSDAADITAGLEGFVSAAAEKGLVSGYEDGTFKPKGNITRAEAVTMLSSVLKQFPQNDDGQPENPEQSRPGDPQNSSPTVVLTKLPETVDTNSVKVEGTVTDKSGEKIEVFVNGDKAVLSSDGKFSMIVNLKEGKNEIIVVAKNSVGETKLSNEVTYTPKPVESAEREQFWGFLTETPYSVKVDNEKGYEFNVWNGVEDRMVRINTNADLSNKMPKGSVGYFTMNSDGSAAVDHYYGRFGALTGVSDSELEIRFKNSSEEMETKTYEYNDTVILNVEEDGTGVPGSVINYLAEEKSDGTFTNNVYFVDDYGDLACIVISVDGRWNL